ncbi:MAG TPA: hypothetical protein VGC54_09260 [Planctomycetota bacterium]
MKAELAGPAFENAGAQLTRTSVSLIAEAAPIPEKFGPEPLAAEPEVLAREALELPQARGAMAARAASPIATDRCRVVLSIEL